VAVRAGQVAVLVGHHGQGLVGGEGLQQRQAQQQVVARPAHQAEGRALHHRRIDLVDHQHPVKARALHLPAHAVQGLQQGGGLGPGDLAALGDGQAHEQGAHPGLHQQPQRPDQEDQQLAQLEQQQQGRAAGEGDGRGHPQQQHQAQADGAQQQRQDAEAQQGQQRHLDAIGPWRRRALPLQAIHHGLETTHVHCCSPRA